MGTKGGGTIGSKADRAAGHDTAWRLDSYVHTEEGGLLCVCLYGVTRGWTKGQAVLRG